jgi:energy-coupling factor transport system permease protein
MKLNSYIAHDITLGQYYPADSLLHKLDPRVKLLGTFVFAITLFLSRGIIAYGYIALFLSAVFTLSGIPVIRILKSVLPAVGFILFIAFFQLFSSQGNPIITFKLLSITDQSLRNTANLIFRLGILLLGTSIMTLTTTPKDLTDGLEKGLGFLTRIKIPVHDMALAMTIALRFIPILSEKTGEIIRAQISRGGDFEEGIFFRRLLNMVPLLIPLLVSAFWIAFDLSVAMEARCYNGSGNRTKMYPLRYSSRDFFAHGIILAFFTGGVLIRVLSPK